ncbi:MAG: hypothetical protein GYA15_08355 [Leptolinea sp.]|jgi:hypothetical protein|nr:hypothetical protein [Leptolinea sp.]
MFEKIKISRAETTYLMVSLFPGGLLAWLLRDLWTPLVSAGLKFTERSLPVQMLLLIIFSLFFALFIRGLIRINAGMENPRPLLAFTGGLTGALIFYLIYGIGTLDTGRVDWLFNLGDNAQHYLGWVFYRNDPWMFPIGFSCSLGYPIGTCMCFMDSIPLLAIPLKLFNFLLPRTFQYFGWWTLACFVLQGALSSLILYETSAKRLAGLIAPLFFCTADILLFRVFRYTPLTGQWIVLLALYLYFLNKKSSKHNSLWPLVHVMAVLIQGYFFVMTFVIFCGTLLEQYLKDRRMRPVIGRLLISLVSVGLTMWIVGFFTASVDMSDAGLGYFKANLNAFINPLPGWSRFFQPLPLAPDTYTMNVNYLGSGIILLFFAGLVVQIIQRKITSGRIFEQNAGLWLIIPVLVIFALSHVITLNDRILFTYNLPEPIMKLWGVFRGTERMLWPVYYLIFIFAIGQASTFTRREWLNAVILLAAFSVQVIEVEPRLQQFHTEFENPQGKHTTLRSEFWEEAASRFNSVVILPLNLQNWDQLTRYAAENGLNINYSYFARQSPQLEPAAQEKLAALKNGQPVPGEMYIIKSSELFRQLCDLYDKNKFFAYVNKEWVLAPGFEKQPLDYPDIAITADLANCGGLSLEDFLLHYKDKLLILSAMDDISALRDDGVLTTLHFKGLELNLPLEPGKSYLAVISGDRVILEISSDQKIEYTLDEGREINEWRPPVDMTLSSAGRISEVEDAMIKVNGRDYSYHQNGLNVVVMDPQTGRILDTAVFAPEN